MLKNQRKKTIGLLSILVILTSTLTPLIAASTEGFLEEHPQKNNDEKRNIFDLLVLTPKEFYNTLQPLKTHKEKHDVKTKIVTLDKVYEEMFWHGRDKPEKIKYFIKKAYEEWGIKYVLLIGGLKGQSNKWYLPPRYIKMGNNWEHEILSDLYYADIYDENSNFSTWDSDNDGSYAEWFRGKQPEDVNIDLTPDLAIGRLPCRNKHEVKIMVNKIIKYENSNFFSKPWFKRFLLIAGDTYPEILNPKWKGYEGEYYADRAAENMTGFTPICLYTSDGTLTEWKDIIPKFNQGNGFVYFVGHGSPMSWSNNLPNQKRMIKSFKIFHVPLLINMDKLPVCVLSGCHNLQFDVSIFKILNETKKHRLEYAPESLGWLITRKEGGGTIATLGCTALGYTKEDKKAFRGGINKLEVQFFKQYGKNNVKILGDTWKETITWYTNQYKVDWNKASNDDWIDAQVVETWILFGDPSLKIGGAS